MPPAVDFLHDRAIMEALLAVLNVNLPAAWRDEEDHRFGLKTLKIGRMQDYDLTDEEKWRDFCPALLIRPLRDAVRGFALGGPQEVDHPIRIVHLFHRENCVDSAGDSIEPVLAQADRAKSLTPAILKDLSGVADLSLTAATLTTTDTTASVLKGSSRITGVSFEGEGVEFPAGPYWSVVIDYNVVTVTE